MAAPRQDASHGPQLEATDARQSRPNQGAFLMLAISTVLGLIVVALIWAVFAGPLHHAPAKPQVQSPDEASGFHQPPPQAKLHPTPNNTGASNGSQVNQQ
jgi:hypothetical protein